MPKNFDESNLTKSRDIHWCGLCGEDIEPEGLHYCVAEQTEHGEVVDRLHIVCKVMVLSYCKEKGFDRWEPDGVWRWIWSQGWTKENILRRVELEKGRG